MKRKHLPWKGLWENSEIREIENKDFKNYLAYVNQVNIVRETIY